MARNQTSFNSAEGLFDNKNKIKKTEKKIVDKKNTEYVQKGYYITPEQYKAMKLHLATNEEDKDMSDIVRKALDLYLNL